MNRFRWPYPTDVAERVGVGGRGIEGEAAVLAGELVRAVDTTVAGVAEGGLVRTAEHQSLPFAAKITQHLHLSHAVRTVSF